MHRISLAQKIKNCFSFLCNDPCATKVHQKILDWPFSPDSDSFDLTVDQKGLAYAISDWYLDPRYKGGFIRTNKGSVHWSVLCAQHLNFSYSSELPLAMRLTDSAVLEGYTHLVDYIIGNKVSMNVFVMDFLAQYFSITKKLPHFKALISSQPCMSVVPQFMEVVFKNYPGMGVDLFKKHFDLLKMVKITDRRTSELFIFNSELPNEVSFYALFCANAMIGCSMRRQMFGIIYSYYGSTEQLHARYGCSELNASQVSDCLSFNVINLWSGNTGYERFLSTVKEQNKLVQKAFSRPIEFLTK